MVQFLPSPAGNSATTLSPTMNVPSRSRTNSLLIILVEPCQAMFMFVELPVLQRAMVEVFGADAEKAKLRDVSAFTDEPLSSLMERLRDELKRDHASQLFVSAIAQATTSLSEPRPCSVRPTDNRCPRRPPRSSFHANSTSQACGRPLRSRGWG